MRIYFSGGPPGLETGIKGLREQLSKENNHYLKRSHLLNIGVWCFV
jgi:hypothetical protein